MKINKIMQIILKFFKNWKNYIVLLLPTKRYKKETWINEKINK